MVTLSGGQVTRLPGASANIEDHHHIPTRATIKAHLPSPLPARPYGYIGFLPIFLL
jgi:hypothetical protein